MVDFVSHVVQILVHRRLPKGSCGAKSPVIFLAIRSESVIQRNGPIIDRDEQGIKTAIYSNSGPRLIACRTLAGCNRDLVSVISLLLIVQDNIIPTPSTRPILRECATRRNQSKAFAFNRACAAVKITLIIKRWNCGLDFFHVQRISISMTQTQPMLIPAMPPEIQCIFISWIIGFRPLTKSISVFLSPILCSF
jgi:hypothetical protein